MHSRSSVRVWRSVHSSKRSLQFGSPVPESASLSRQRDRSRTFSYPVLLRLTEINLWVLDNIEPIRREVLIRLCCTRYGTRSGIFDSQNSTQRIRNKAMVMTCCIYRFLSRVCDTVGNREVLKYELQNAAENHIQRVPLDPSTDITPFDFIGEISVAMLPLHNFLLSRL